MPALAETTLSEVARRVLDLLVRRLEETVAPRSVWLFGSRARGEEARDADSDVDLLVVTAGGRADAERVNQLVHEVAEAEDANPWRFSRALRGRGRAHARRVGRAPRGKSAGDEQ